MAPAYFGGNNEPARGGCDTVGGGGGGAARWDLSCRYASVAASGLPELGGGPGIVLGKRLAFGGLDSRSMAAAAALAAACIVLLPVQSPGGGSSSLLGGGNGGLGIFFSFGIGTVLLSTYSTEGEA